MTTNATKPCGPAYISSTNLKRGNQQTCKREKYSGKGLAVYYKILVTMVG